MEKKSFSIPAICLLTVFSISSFAPGIGQGEEIKPRGEIIVASNQNTFEMRKVCDPHTSFGAGTCRTLTTLVFDCLLTKDAQGAFQSALAESWKISKDWSSISFKLRQGITFHNGDPFTAQDVKFSIERAMRDDLKFTYGPEMKGNIAKVEILDLYHVRVHLKGPYPAFLDRNASALAIVPKNYVERVGDEGFAAKPVGAGPFRVMKFERDVSFDAEAVEKHYRKTPFVKKLRLLAVAEHATRLAMLKAGEADLIMAHPTQIPLLQKDPHIKIIWSKHTFLLSLVFHDLAHPEDSPFKSPLVRKATSLAIDRKGIADAIGNGTLEPWGSFLAPYHLGFDPKRNKPDPYDPAEAKRLLAKAGYPNGFDTVLVYQPTVKERFEAIQPQLQEVGIRCRMSMLEGGTWSAAFVAAKHRGIGYGSGPWWAGITHPAAALGGHIKGTWSHKLATPEILKSMEKVEQAVGANELADASGKLDQTILESMVRTPLWSVHTPYAVGKRVEDYTGVPGVIVPVGFEHLRVAGK